MIGDAVSPLRDACYSALSGNSAFMALVTGVFDQQAPVGQAMNYVLMGPSTQLPDNRLGKGGRVCTITFEIFTQGSLGSQAAGLIVDALLKALVQTTLVLSTTPAQTCTYVDLDNYSDQIQSDEPVTFHGSARLLFRTQET